MVLHSVIHHPLLLVRDTRPVGRMGYTPLQSIYLGTAMSQLTVFRWRLCTSLFDMAAPDAGPSFLLFLI